MAEQIENLKRQSIPREIDTGGMYVWQPDADRIIPPKIRVAMHVIQYTENDPITLGGSSDQPPTVRHAALEAVRDYLAADLKVPDLRTRDDL